MVNMMSYRERKWEGAVQGPDAKHCSHVSIFIMKWSSWLPHGKKSRRGAKMEEEQPRALPEDQVTGAMVMWREGLGGGGSWEGTSAWPCHDGAWVVRIAPLRCPEPHGAWLPVLAAFAPWRISPTLTQVLWLGNKCCDSTIGGDFGAYHEKMQSKGKDAKQEN